MPSLRAYSFLVLALCCMPALAEIYRWVDSSGKVHFSDRPQPGSTQPLQVSPAASADPHLAERRRKQRRLLEAIEQEREEKRAAEREAERQHAGRRHNCARALDQLRMVDRQGRVYELDEAGKRRYWDEQTRQRQRATIARYLDDNCK